MIPICHVQVLPLMSGVQRSMLEIFKQLDRSRYEIHVACQGPGPLTDELDRIDIRWHAIPSLDRAIRPHKDWRAYCDLYSLFKRERFQLVHTHSSKPGILARVAARRAGVPCVIHHVRGFAFHEFSPPPKRWIYSRLERWAGKYCDRVLFVNQEEHDLSVREGWLPADKCQTIYNGVDLEAVDPLRQAPARNRLRTTWNLRDDEVAILFAARLDAQKQPMILPEIARALRDHHTRHPWRLIIAGNGPAQATVEKQIANSNLGEHVKLVGWQDDPYAAFAAADIVLLPSLFEGLPRTLIEAQGAGLATVASNIKGNREVVTTETGFLCPAKDPAAYAEKLALLIDNASLRKQFGRAARLRAEQHFDTVINHRRIAALYDELLGLTATTMLHRAA